MADVLVVIADGAEEIETTAVADILVRAGHSVCMACDDALQITGSRGLLLGGHEQLNAVLDRDFDLVYIPGGIQQAEFCRDDERVQALIAKQLGRTDAFLAIICASPISLLPQGLAQGRKITSHPSKQEELAEQAEWTGNRIEQDGNLITSQGPGTAIELGLYLVQLLGTEEQAASIADAMLAALPKVAN